MKSLALVVSFKDMAASFSETNVCIFNNLLVLQYIGG